MRFASSLFRGFLFCSAMAVADCGLNAAEEPLFEGLGSYSRKIKTRSPNAQQYFDQGLGFLYGFNHAAAIRAFERVAELEPESAIAYWGLALAYGPHINYPTVL